MDKIKQPITYKCIPMNKNCHEWRDKKLKKEIESNNNFRM